MAAPLGAYFFAYLGFARGRAALALVLVLLAAATEGIGLLMLVPLLHVVGVGDGVGRIGEVAAGVLDHLGAPLTLEAILPLFVLLVTLRVALAGWRDVTLERLTLGFVDHVRRRLFGAIVAADWLFLSRTRNAELTHALTSDIPRIAAGTYFFSRGWVLAFMIVAQLAVALHISIGTTLVGIVFGLGALAALTPLLRRAQALGSELTESGRRALAVVTDYLAALKLAKSLGVEQAHRERFAAAIDEARAQELAFTSASVRMHALHNIAAAAGVAAIAYVGLRFIDAPAAELLVLLLVLARAAPMLLQLHRHLHEIAFMLPAFMNARRLQNACAAAAEAPQSETAERPPPAGLAHGVRLDRVSFAYDPGAPERLAIEAVSLDLRPRETVALVGPSGAGKSTIADILMGLLKPTSGAMLVDGRPLGDGERRCWRRRVAYVPQDTFLFNDTIRANFLWAAPSASEDELWQALEAAAASDFVRRLDHGLDTPLGERAVRLSGGERQRIAVARALLRRPALIVFDEATSALDVETERQVQASIQALHGSVAVVIIAHRLSTIRVADRIVVLDRGRIVESGTWATLMAGPDSRLRRLHEAAATPPDH